RSYSRTIRVTSPWQPRRFESICIEALSFRPEGQILLLLSGDGRRLRYQREEGFLAPLEMTNPNDCMRQHNGERTMKSSSSPLVSLGGRSFFRFTHLPR